MPSWAIALEIPVPKKPKDFPVVLFDAASPVLLEISFWIRIGKALKPADTFSISEAKGRTALATWVIWPANLLKSVADSSLLICGSFFKAFMVEVSPVDFCTSDRPDKADFNSVIFLLLIFKPERAPFSLLNWFATVVSPTPPLVMPFKLFKAEVSLSTLSAAWSAFDCTFSSRVSSSTLSVFPPYKIKKPLPHIEIAEYLVWVLFYVIYYVL